MSQQNDIINTGSVLVTGFVLGFLFVTLLAKEKKKKAPEHRKEYIRALIEELNDCVANEKYERAAEIRDELKNLGPASKKYLQS